jgi:hypothetical protein
MKEFISAIEEKPLHPDDVDVPLMFKIDGHECRAYRPTDGQMAMVMTSLGRHVSDATKVAGIIDFFITILDDESHQYVVERLLSRDDALGLEQVEEVMMWLIEEWSGRPTQKPAVSTGSQANGGPKSKPRTTKRTSSRSAHGSSAT